MASTRPWPSVPDEHRWVVELMEERLDRTERSPEELKARAHELRAEAKQTDVDGFREAALALADRYEQTASRLASA